MNPTENEPIPLGNDLDCPPAELPPVRHVNVKGRKEHEAFLKDAEKCKEYGLDQMYETIVYLKRWGGWLEDDTDKIK